MLRLKCQKVGESDFQGRPFRIKCGKAVADLGNFVIVERRRKCHDDDLPRLSLGQPVADLRQ